MGNRAYIVFDQTYEGQRPKGGDALPAVYLHWNGGPESIYTFLAYCKAVCRQGDREYIPARFVQIVGNYFGGNLSLGLTATTRDDIPELASVGDNGVYVVNVDTFDVTQRWYSVLKNENDPVSQWVWENKPYGKARIASEKKAALADDYNRDDRLLNAVKAVNDAFFNCQFGQEVEVTVKGEPAFKAVG